MGILDDYFNNSPDTSPVAVTPSGSVLNQYFDEALSEKGKAKAITIRPVAPPISGATPEQSDVINAQPAQQGGANPREGILQVPVKAIKAVGSAIGEGGIEAGQGVSDILSNKPATGFGEIGTGLARIVASPTEGLSQLAGDITGSKDIAERAGFAAGFLPVAKTFQGVKSLSTKNEAFRKLVEDIGPNNAGKVAQEMRASPTITPADLAPSVRQGVQRLYANVEGPHVNYLEDTTRNRMANAAKDLEQHMNTNLGSVVNPVKKQEELIANIRKVGDQQIAPAIKGAKPVDLTNTINKIDEILNPGVSSAITHDTILSDPELEGTLRHLRKYLTDDQSVRISPEQLNRIQSAFRKKAETLQATKPELSKAIYQVRNNIVDAIDKASGGKYKPALEGYRDEFHIHDAFQHGYDTIMKNGKNLEDRPEYFEKWVKDATKEEAQAAREGARIAYDTQMYAFKNAARRGTDIGDVEFNNRRMAALFGKDEAARMAKAFENAKKVAETNNKLLQGSQSRVQQAQNTYFEPYNPEKKDKTLSHVVSAALPIASEVGGHFLGAPLGVGGVAAAAGLGLLKGGSMLAGKAKTNIIKSLENERNLRYAKYALPTQGPDREELIKALEAVSARQSPKLSIKQKTSLARLVSP